MPFRIEDKSLALPDGRTLAYADNGNTSSKTLVLFLHGAFMVGDASRPPKFLMDRQIHFSVFTWLGKSSPAKDGSLFPTTLVQDISSLLQHLPSGRSPAQILYCMPYNIFPFGQSIVGMLLLSPHSPPHCAAMSWRMWLLNGPYTRYLPLLPSLVKYNLSKKMKSQEDIEKNIVSNLYPMKAASEIDLYTKWRTTYEVDEGKLESETAAIIALSIAKTWAGFDQIPWILHSGWGGARPDQLDEAHARPPILIITSTDDSSGPQAAAAWLVTAFKNAKLVILEGGHMVAFLQLDRLWSDLFDMAEPFVDHP
ncbi:Alpha/Beta hydrolase protein [Flagelloscypha sp. PMI_526]|nr:Alpha/Beta hydrolase protein [Flagelloscypha sp. PMI_526]